MNQGDTWQLFNTCDVSRCTPCRSFEDRVLDMSNIFDIRNPISRYVKSRCNLSRQIKVKSRPLIPTLVGVSGIESWTCQRLLTSGIPISRYVKSRCNLSHQIKVESGPLIPALVRISGIES
jgi:hypothetical protein